MNQNQRLPETLVDHLAFSTVWKKSIVRARQDGLGWLPEAETEYVKNTIVNCGMDYLAQQISSWAAPAKMTHMIVGTSTAVPTLSDYRLPGEVTGGRKAFAATSVSNNTWHTLALKQDGYSWWVERMGAVFKQFDVVRMDHFRG